MIGAKVEHVAEAHPRCKHLVPFVPYQLNTSTRSVWTTKRTAFKHVLQRKTTPTQFVISIMLYIGHSWAYSGIKSFPGNCLTTQIKRVLKRWSVTGHRPYVRVDMAIQVGGAGEGQLFGLKIEQLKFGKLLIRSTTDPLHSFYALRKIVCLTKYNKEHK